MQQCYRVALIFGSIGGVAMMAFHPEGHDTITERGSFMMLLVHLAGLLNIGLLAFGSVGIVRALGSERADVTGGGVAYGFAMAAVIPPIVISAFIIPAMAKQIWAIDKVADPIAYKIIMQSLSLCGQWIQGCVKAFVLTMFVAIALWSLAMLRTRLFPKSLAIYGLVVGVAIPLAVLSNQLRMSAHGFAAVMLAIGVWSIWSAIRAPNDAFNKV